LKRAACIVLVVLVGSWLPAPTAAQEIDPFYTRLLADGLRSSERGDHLRASEELRIAAFGLMESPEQLARALTHLALSLSAAGNSESFAATMSRLAELESRFGAYTSTEIGAAARADLNQAARGLMSADEIQNSPLLAPAAAAPAPSATAQKAQTKLCISWTAGGECRQPGAAAAEPDLAPEQDPPTEPALSWGPTEEERAAFDRLARLAAGKGSSKKLRKGFEEARALADTHPDWPEVQRVAGLLAARSASYPEAVTYYRKSGEPAEDQPVELFYLSVALFETDQLEAAAATLRRALPGLDQNREVRRYIRQILTPETQS